MPRQAFLAPGLVALALFMAPALATTAAAAQDAKPQAGTQDEEEKANLKRGLLDKIPDPKPQAGAPEKRGVVHPAAENAAQAAAAAEGHGGGEPNILEFQPSLAIWTVVVFFGLILLLGRFAWKPLIAALHQREEHLEHVLLETEKARNESEQLLAEHRRRLAASEDQVKAMIDEGRKQATAAGDDIVKRAQEEADASRQRAQTDIASARDQALSEIWSKTADLAVSVAGKVLSKSLSEDEHRRLVESALGELSAAAGEGSGRVNGHKGARA